MELLVVIGIITVLLGVLLPAICAARRRAQLARCASNIRQIGVAFVEYAAENKGWFPPNVSTPSPAYWCDSERIGGLVQAPNALGTGVGGGVLRCPSDDDDAKRSYAPNVYTSAKVDANVLKNLSGKALWNRLTQSSRVMLILEAWSCVGSPDPGYSAPYTVGMAGSTAGQRFGGGTGVSPALDEARYSSQITELAFGRHAALGGVHQPATNPLPGERLNFGYADGHVEEKTAAQLVNLQSGDTTGDSLWSQADLDAQFITVSVAP